MDIEQFKMLLETIEAVGGDAKEFGIWWIACQALPQALNSVLLFLFGAFAFRCVYLIFCSLIRTIPQSHHLAEMMGIIIVGNWNRREEAKVRNRLKKLLEIEQEYLKEHPQD